MLRHKAERDFERGPYRYTRNPTHIGLSLVTLGFGLIMGSWYILICMVVASVLAKFVFLRTEEAILERRYGQPYLQYKAKIKTWV
jgi:protein-S-isoprenylcysteine O-methyltransferase Ste14